MSIPAFGMLFRVKWCSFILLCFQVIKSGDSILSKVQQTSIKTNITNYLEFSVVESKELKQKGVLIHPYALKIANNSKTGFELGRQIVFTMTIYAYTRDYIKTQVIEAKLNAFFICMNCEVSFYVKNGLFVLLRDLPMFYQTKYFDVNYTNEFGKNFEDNNKTKLQNLASYVDMFIHNLNTLIEVEPDALLSNETIVLQTLYELKFKIDFFMTVYQDKSATLSDDIIIRQFLNVMNVLQMFIVTNCENKAPTTVDEILDNKRVFSYFINTTNLKDKETFFNAINEIVLKPHSYLQKGVPVEQMLLRSFVTEGESKVPSSLSSVIRDAQIVMDKSGKMVVKNVFDEVKNSYYDIELVFFYAKSVFFTIMKIIHSKTKSLLLAHNKPDQNDKETINSLKNKINSEIFPAELFHYFDELMFLVETEDDTSVVMDKMSEIFSELLDSVELQEFDLDVSLDQLIDIIIEHQDEFECFNVMFKFLRKTFGKHYVPFLVDEERRNYIRHFVRDTANGLNQVSSFGNGKCNFIDGMFRIYLDIMSDINRSTIDSNPMLNSTNYTQEACKNIETVKAYFVHTINHEKNDYNIRKIAHNSLIVLFNFKCLTSKHNFVDNYKRLVDLLTHELNSYGIVHCSYPASRLGYLLYNNLNMNNFGNRHAAKALISSGIGVFPGTLDTLPDNMSTHKSYFDLRKLYKVIAKNSKVIECYSSVVKFYWKGELKNFRRLYTHATSGIILNFQFMYSFYDVYFKFYIAAFFFEIDKFHKYLTVKTDIDPKNEKVVSYKNNVNNFFINCFPKTLWPFITKLKKFALSVTEPLEAAYKSNHMLLSIHTEHFEKESKIIKKQFSDWNFIVKTEHVQEPIVNLNFNCAKIFPNFFKRNLELLVKELYETPVRNTLAKYLLLHQDNNCEII